MKAHRIRVYKSGGPSALKWEEFDVPKPKSGEVVIRQTAVGFNMVDTYIRSGLYARAPLPCGLGLEGAGVIAAVGRGVTKFKPGNRVVYSGGGAGSYAEMVVRGTRGLTKIPTWLDDKTAAAALLKGRTVEYLFNRSHKLKKGETILFTAAAGGVGLIAGQWAKAVGAIAIGTVSTEAKAKLAKRNGYNHVIVTSKKDTAKEVMRITKGKGVDVVYDSNGKDSWRASLDSVRRRGLIVSFGSASGTPPPFDLVSDGMVKSIYVTRATSVNYMTSDAIEQASARALFRMMKSGAVKVRIGQTYALKDAGSAHRDAEARRTTGSTILLP